jgi:hypothetical protein
MNANLTQRALAAYFRMGGNQQPSQSASGIETLAGKDYVILRNVRDVLAVYRVLNNGALKFMRRYPRTFDK